MTTRTMSINTNHCVPIVLLQWQSGRAAYFSSLSSYTTPGSSVSDDYAHSPPPQCGSESEPALVIRIRFSYPPAAGLRLRSSYSPDRISNKWRPRVMIRGVVTSYAFNEPQSGQAMYSAFFEMKHLLQGRSSTLRQAILSSQTV